MSTEVQNRSANAIAALGNLKTGLANVVAAIPQAGGEPILKFVKGQWLFGADNVEVEQGSRWAANPLSLQHGYICWKDTNKYGKPAEKLGEQLYPMTSPKPMKETLPKYEQGVWTDQVSITFLCMDGEDEGTQVVFKPSSVGGLDESAEFIKEIMKQIDKDPHHPVPVVVFGEDGYNHSDRSIGWVKTPVLEIVEWVSLEDATPADEDEPEQAPQPEPVKEPEQAQRTSRRAAAPEPAQEEQRTEPAPAAATAESGERRRRRRAA